MFKILTRRNSTVKIVSLANFRWCHTFVKSKEYAKCYRILEVPNNSDEETVRRAFIELCKKYHPDTKKGSPNPQKFQEIESAYRLLQKKFSNEGIGEYGLYYENRKKNVDDGAPEVFDINHTAPQHRQYLSYEGVGSGTPFEREKQYIKYRRAVAAENVHDHHVRKLTVTESSSLVSKNKEEAKKIKTRYGMERLVEDLIQESMAKGQFDNLRGTGKPLPNSNYNPYVDFTTHKMNEILMENGFVPEWINLQKEISDETRRIKEKLWSERQKLGSQSLGPTEKMKWRQVLESLRESVAQLNKKINKYNLIVPILDKQKIHFNLERESCDILKVDNPAVRKVSTP